MKIGDEEWHEFGVDYNDQSGSTFGFNIWAKDFEDAQQRLERIKSNGRISGQLVATWPAWVPLWLVRLHCWWMNLWANGGG